MKNVFKALLVGAIAAAALASVAATAGSAASSRSNVQAKACSFELRVGDVLPFTGDLAAYGANLDRAVKLAVTLQNAALKSAGLKGASVKLVGSEDGQTQASASVEAATKLVKVNKANVIIGEMASGATIPMAQSVTIPSNVVLISPTSSAPQITLLKDKGLVYRTYPSDALQGKVLAQAALAKFGKGATINIGARNDAFGSALQALVVSQWKKLGGNVGATVSWNPDQANFDTDAQKLVEGNPAGWIIIDFPDTFEKFVPSLVRSGKWSASKTLMTEALRNATELDKIGEPVKACSSAPGKIKANLRAVSAAPGKKVTFINLGAAVKTLAAGKDVDYEGAFSPVDFDANGDIGSAVYEIWQYNGAGQIATLKTITFRS